MIPYKHEPFTDFSQKENQKAFKEGLKLVESYLGQDYPLIIGGERVTTEDKIVSVNPANKEELIGRDSKAA
jgi:1-pyrroline-5-carboxylate dehydrogenase